MNAPVFQEPVAALAQVSLPCIMTGIDKDWTAVGFSQPIAFMAYIFYSLI
jgi:hypothetical protein